MTITHVEFDLDGTLVNSMDVLIEMYANIARDHGTVLTKAFIEAIPNFDIKKAPYEMMQRELGFRITPEELHQKIIQARATFQYSLLPGVERLVRHLRRHRIPMAVATGSYRDAYRTIAKQFDNFFPKHFSHAVCGYDDPDVIENKPGPDVYRICADRFGDPPVTDISQVLVFKDSITGLIGAIKSGAKTVLISGEQQLNDPKNCTIIDQATLVVESLQHFRPEMVGLPPFDE